PQLSQVHLELFAEEPPDRRDDLLGLLLAELGGHAPVAGWRQRQPRVQSYSPAAQVAKTSPVGWPSAWSCHRRTVEDELVYSLLRSRQEHPASGRSAPADAARRRTSLTCARRRHAGSRRPWS